MKRPNENNAENFRWTSRVRRIRRFTMRKAAIEISRRAFLPFRTFLINKAFVRRLSTTRSVLPT